MNIETIRYTTIDALNHVMEACTTVIATPYSITLAREAGFLIHKYLPIALADPQNVRSRYWLTYAAIIAGLAADESWIHLTHALEHTLSAVNPKIAHG